jgi:hypothetical protein
LDDDDRQQLVWLHKCYGGFWLNYSNDENYFMRPNNFETLENLAKLFYGLRCLVSHGNVDKTLHDNGVLAQEAEALELDLTVLKRQETTDENKVKYLMTEDHVEAADRGAEIIRDIWKKAREQKHNVEINFQLYRSAHSFYLYFSQCLRHMLGAFFYPLIDLHKKTPLLGVK